MAQHTILVVDDDALLRMHVADLLTDAGYVVVEAGNADAALKILGEDSRVDLLFTDVQMPPGANGLALAQVVQDRWPHVLLLVASGGVELTDDDIPDGGKFLPKPYPDRKIVGQIDKLLGVSREEL